jgi:hypothetical protein
MPVGVRLAGRVIGTVGVAVVLIMHMAVLVRHRLVAVLVVMLLGQMQIDAQAHEQGGADQLNGDRLAKQGQG